MAQTIKLKRSATSGAVPTTSALALGEMAINTHDGKVYIKKNDGTESVVEVGDTSGYLPLSGGTLTGTLDLGTQNIAVDSTKGFVNSGQWTRNQTPYGYIDFGPANANHAHIYTDRASFYFNKELYVNAARVFHDGFHPNADKWTTARTLTLNGDVTGSVSWDGSANATLTAAVNDGIGSGLNADLLDGVQGSGYVNTSSTQSIGGIKSFISETKFGSSYVDPDSGVARDAKFGTNGIAVSGGIKTDTLNGGTPWTSSNDGSGSGLDADLLDGQQGSYYYPASNPNGYTNDQTAAEILTAIKTVDGSGSGLDADTVDGHHAYESQILDTRNSGDVTPDGFGDKRVSYSFTDDIAGSTHTWDSVITVKGWSDTYRAWQITSNSSNDDTDQNLYFRSGRGATWGSLRTVWDSGNDGAGSGLDADLLDGVQGSGYVNTTGTQTVGGVKNFTSNVGIGTSSPPGKLTISNNGAEGIEFFPANASGLNTTQHYNRSGAAYVVNNVIASEHRFNIGTSERARLDTSGNLLINKTATNASVLGCELKSNGIIYSTIDIPVLTGGIQIRNNALTDSLTGIRCYNGLADIPTTSSTGGGHSLSISGGLSGEYARFTNAKRLGIGTTAPAESLHVVGNIVATGNITAFYSDERLKDLKGTIPNALDKVNQLNGYYYTPNETAQALGVDNKGLEVGISAQEVEAVLPEIVTKSAIGDDYKTVWYEKLTPLLIEAVKELTEKVDKLEARLTELEK